MIPIWKTFNVDGDFGEYIINLQKSFDETTNHGSYGNDCFVIFELGHSSIH